MGEIIIMICKDRRLTAPWKAAVPDIFTHSVLTEELCSNIVERAEVLSKRPDIGPDIINTPVVIVLDTGSDIDKTRIDRIRPYAKCVECDVPTSDPRKILSTVCELQRAAYYIQ